MSRATQHTGYSRPVLLDPFLVLLCALGGWSLQSLHSLSLSDGSALGGTCKARRKERLAYLCSCSLSGGPLWQKVSGQLFCPQGSLPRLQRLPSPSCSLSFSRPGGRNSVGSFPLLLVAGCFPALWWSRDPLCTSANRPFTACLQAPSEHEPSTSNRTLLMSRAGI